MTKILDPQTVYADGKHLDTKALQAFLDAAGVEATQTQPCSAVIPAGTYLTASLFVPSHVHLQLAENAVLLATTDETQYPVLKTRVAGVEMPWYVGLLNVQDASDVTITGPGAIDGNGPYWWHKYWGDDRHGGMRHDYEAQGLRWAVDYDCRRLRNLVVMNSRQVAIDGIESRRSGFWNLHICYSSQVVVQHIKVSDAMGPSTDGIDIDSSHDVEVKNCAITCNDDQICLKAGRDADGLRVNRPCYDVSIHDCQLYAGAGITLGSETSGGIHDITVKNVQYVGASCGFRIKSAKNRGGVIEKIHVSDLNVKQAKQVFAFELNWNPAYSYSEIPADYTGAVPAHWQQLLTAVPEAIGLPTVRDVHVSKVVASDTQTAFALNGFPERPMTALSFTEMQLNTETFGEISGVSGVELNDVTVSVAG